LSMLISEDILVFELVSEDMVVFDICKFSLVGNYALLQLLYSTVCCLSEARSLKSTVSIVCCLSEARSLMATVKYKSKICLQDP